MGFCGQGPKVLGIFGEVLEIDLHCLSSVTFGIHINGSKVEEMEPARGLRQGDPLSVTCSF